MDDIYDDEAGSEKNPELEAKFQSAYDEAIAKINKHLKEANQALGKACKVSEEYGVPFDSTISPLSQGYVPESMDEKFSDLSHSVISEITGVYDPYDSGLNVGWQHSAVC